jgi:hypothetical protein
LRSNTAKTSDEHDRESAGGGLHNRDPEALCWARAEHFDKPDPDAVFMHVDEVSMRSRPAHSLSSSCARALSPRLLSEGPYLGR